MKGRILLCAVSVALAAPGTAPAATYCAPATEPGCTSAAEAFAAAASTPGLDTIVLGELVEPAEPAPPQTFDDGGDPVVVRGAGAGASVLRGTLALSQGSTATGLTATVADLTGAALWRSIVGSVELRGTATLDAVAVRMDGAPGVVARCGASATARHVTVVGSGPAAASIDCADPLQSTSLEISDSVLTGGVDGPVSTRFSWPTEITAPAPGLAADGLRPAAGSPLLDAGDPEPLTAYGATDLDGVPRMADGDGDGAARRDVGAFEWHAPPGDASGNLLRNGGAEDGLTGWAGTGMGAVAYGVDGEFPSLAAGTVLGGGARFFSGAPGSPEGELTQRVDLRPWAPEIDLGTASFALDALVGGYGADEDAGYVGVHFLGPGGMAVGDPLTLPPVTRAHRAHATTLLARAGGGAVPALAREAVVTLRATRAGGTFADAYFDRVRLTLTAPGGPGGPGNGGPGGGGPGPGDPPLQRFSGIAVLTRAATVDSNGRVRVSLACASGTVRGCAGVLSLTAVLGRGRPATGVGRVRFDVPSGRQAVARLYVHSAARRVLRRARSRRLKSSLYASARDGQGLVRTQTSPLTLRRRR